MKFETKTAIITKVIEYKETSVIAKAFSASGKTDFIAYGVNKANSSLTGIIQPLNLVKITYKPKEDGLVILKEASLIETLASINFEVLCYQQATAELFNQIEFEDDETYFELFKAFLEFVKQTTYSPSLVFLRFLLSFCKLLGVDLNTGYCCICGQSTLSAYYPLRQAFICHDCEAKVFADHLIKLSKNSSNILSGIGNLNALKNNNATTELFKIITTHLEETFHKQIRLSSLKLIN